MQQDRTGHLKRTISNNHDELYILRAKKVFVPRGLLEAAAVPFGRGVANYSVTTLIFTYEYTHVIIA